MTGNQIMDHATLDVLLDQLAELLRERITGWESEPLLVGIHRGGVHVADALHQRLGLSSPPGSLDIAFHRDDISTRRLNPQVQPSQLPISLDGRAVVLIDDVLYTGRTIRAALNELFDFGRPAQVLLVVLVDRGGRELPIQADLIGTRLTLADHQHVRLESAGSGAMQLVVHSSRQAGEAG